jgi:Sec-independent protein translocase protein TatA
VLTVDPLKLALIAVVAVVVLGPDKLPLLARRAGSLLKDLQRFRDALQDQAHQVADDLGLSEELRRVPGAFAPLRQLDRADSARHALLRVAGLEVTASGADSAGPELPAGSIDLGQCMPELLRAANTTGVEIAPGTHKEAVLEPVRPGTDHR